MYELFVLIVWQEEEEEEENKKDYLKTFICWCINQ